MAWIAPVCSGRGGQRRISRDLPAAVVVAAAAAVVVAVVAVAVAVVAVAVVAARRLGRAVLATVMPRTLPACC